MTKPCNFKLNNGLLVPQGDGEAKIDKPRDSHPSTTCQDSPTFNGRCRTLGLLVPSTFSLTARVTPQFTTFLNVVLLPQVAHEMATAQDNLKYSSGFRIRDPERLARMRKEEEEGGGVEWEMIMCMQECNSENDKPCLPTAMDVLVYAVWRGWYRLCCLLDFNLS